MEQEREKIGFIRKHRVSLGVFFGTMLLGSIYTYIVYISGLMTLFVDQNSHLNIARLITDSMTPGISQVGFWPPLLHLLMVPFAAITILFESGLAGAFLLVPLFALGALFMYKLIELFTQSRKVSIGGAILFVTNPYMLYYAATPMTEILFITALLGVSYFLLSWLSEQKFSSFIYLALFTTLVSLARFEGLLVVLFVSVIVIAKLLKDRLRYEEIEGMTILFAFIAGLGVLFTVTYGWAFAGDPLEFISGQWSAPTQQESIFLPTAKDFGLSIYYLVGAISEMIGFELFLVALISFTAIMSFYRHNSRMLFNFLALTLVLISPFLFDLFALYSGSAVLYLENLPPFKGFFNERYGLYVYGFTIFVVMSFVGYLIRGYRGKLEFVTRGVLASLLFVALFSYNINFLVKVAVVDGYRVVQKSNNDSPVNDQRELAEVLKSEYQGGKVLITRALHNAVTVNAGIPLKNYIQEANYLFFDQAMERPWLFARYVVSFNPDIIKDDPWRRDNEKITKTWAEDASFNIFYELVFENSSERLYRVREDVLLEHVTSYNIDASLIPSLNIKLARWDPREMQEYIDGQIIKSESLVIGK